MLNLEYMHFHFAAYLIGFENAYIVTLLLNNKYRFLFIATSPTVVIYLVASRPVTAFEIPTSRKREMAGFLLGLVGWLHLNYQG